MIHDMIRYDMKCYDSCCSPYSGALGSAEHAVQDSDDELEASDRPFFVARAR